MVNYNEEKQKLKEALKITSFSNSDEIEETRNILESQIGFKSEKHILTCRAILYSIRRGEFWPDREVICYVGPAGVGKTTFVQKLAQALKRPLRTVSLAGLKEFKEFSILGNTKDKPGLIAWAIKLSNCRNPIILLDELEKVVNTNVQKELNTLIDKYKKGETIYDEYFQEKIDLSHITLFATVNDEDALSINLKSKVFVKYLEDYSPDEKIKILKKKVVEAQKLYGIKDNFVLDECIEYLVKYHIQEAGVRKLDQALDKLAEEYLIARKENRIAYQGNQVEWVKKNVFPYKEQFNACWSHWMLFSSLAVSFLFIAILLFRKFLLRTGKKGDIKNG